MKNKAIYYLNCSHFIIDTRFKVLKYKKARNDSNFIEMI